MKVIKEFTRLAVHSVANNLPVVPTPLVSMVSSFLTYHRKKERGGHLVGGQSVEDIAAFGEQHLISIDTLRNVGGVVSVLTEPLRDEPFFAILLSTRGLLEGTNLTSPIEIDETYKLIYEGFALTVIGQSDMNRVFHVR